MSLLDDVSIVVTPNGYKAGKLYAVIPSSGTADMDVTRATAATRVDENGLVNYAELIGGEDLDISSGSPVFPSDWSSATANSVNFLGSSSAVSYYEDVATGMILGKTYRLELTISGYSGTGTTGFSNQGGTGSLGGVYSLDTDGIISILFISDGLNLRMFSRSTVTNVVFSNVSVKEVIRDNVPRIDYTGGGCPHILSEPQRTNLVTYSEVYGSGTFFSSTSGSVIDNTTSISPSGDANATQVTSTGAGKIQSGGKGLTQNTDYVLSFYAKNVDATEVTSRVLALGGSGGSNLTSVSYISELSTTEWTRITHSFNTGTNTTIYVYISNILNSGGTIQLWGAQLEEGSYATSYIPTSGSTVTRNQDIFSRDGIGSLINSTEGVLFVEMADFEGDDTYRYLGLNDGTDDNRVVILYYLNNNRIRAVLSSGGVNLVDEYYTVSSLSDFHKIALKWKENDFSLWVNGVERATATSVTVPVGLSHLSFDKGGGTNTFNGKVRQLQVYKTALSDDTLALLTS